MAGVVGLLRAKRPLTVGFVDSCNSRTDCPDAAWLLLPAVHDRLYRLCLDCQAGWLEKMKHVVVGSVVVDVVVAVGFV